MSQVSVGIRELKARLGSYMRRVKSGGTLVITERGKPVGRIVPVSPSADARARELERAGLVAWSGRTLTPRTPTARTRGKRTVAELLLEDRK